MYCLSKIESKKKKKSGDRNIGFPWIKSGQRLCMSGPLLGCSEKSVITKIQTSSLKSWTLKKKKWKTFSSISWACTRLYRYVYTHNNQIEQRELAEPRQRLPCTAKVLLMTGWKGPVRRRWMTRLHVLQRITLTYLIIIVPRVWSIICISLCVLSLSSSLEGSR